MNSKEHLLIVDDEEIIIEVFQNLLEDKNFKVSYAKSGEQAYKVLENEDIDLMILDLKLPDTHGEEVFQAVKSMNPTIPVIIITAYGSLQNAVELMKRGVFDYISKPFHNEEVLAAIEKGFRQHEILQENIALKSQVRSLFGLDNIIGQSKQMKNIMQLVLQIAPSKSNVLIAGESGTGKELIARAIHINSPRADRPFMPVNSGNMPSDLLESNLFGHEKGAFTGAIYTKKGLFEVANGGSIFFDEIGTVNQDTQVKLLRVIQEKEFMRLGGLSTIKVDVRIIAATNTDLKKAVSDGRFREDLFYRLNVIDILVPPLRERKEDIPALVDHFIKKYCHENNKNALYCSPKVVDLLVKYDWPGNIRELENVIERAIVLSKGDEISIDLIPDFIALGDFDTKNLPEGDSFYKKVKRYKLDLIRSALKESNGIQKKAARILGVKPTTLNEMLKRYGVRQRLE